MSKIALEGNASGTGTLTIAAPNTSTNRTLTLPDESGTVLTSASTVAASQITSALNATGSAPIYACRAWVNFNGTGTVAIRASGNVSSITDNGTGDYTVNFTTAMPDTNYIVAGAGRQGDSATAGTMRVVCICAVDTLANSMQTSSVRVSTQSSNGAVDDIQVVSVAVFR